MASLMKRVISGVLATALVACLSAQAVAGSVLVAAASSLRPALEEIADAFRRETGEALEISYGSSGKLTRQILNGAPFQLFLSADEEYVGRLEEGGLVEESAVYAVGELVLFIAADSGVQADMNDFAGAVKDGRIDQVVIANPERAPYGRAAEAVLREAKLWSLLQGRLVLGNNVSHAVRFLASGAVEAGFIARSLAMSPGLRARGAFLALPGTRDHLRAKMALLKGAGEAADRFYRYLLGPASRAILARHGLDPARE